MQWDEWPALLPSDDLQRVTDAVGTTDFGSQALIVYGQYQCQAKWSLRTPARGAVLIVVDDSEGLHCVQSAGAGGCPRPGGTATNAVVRGTPAFTHLFL
ncbi:hypothetical protein [Actinomyces oricola]|uniref:hypothetical protein n=1 Tax=Actinomyces oricola TaxID=206043 RepID=UPI000FFEB164|nr:hypothetical protein [Actinomyces oricola]